MLNIDSRLSYYALLKTKFKILLKQKSLFHFEDIRIFILHLIDNEIIQLM